jgi:hypothetical protein
MADLRTRWPNLSPHGVQLRIAHPAEGPPLLVATPLNGAIPGPTAAALATLGFEGRGGAMVRSGLAVTLKDLRAAIGSLSLEEISAQELHGAAVPLPTPAERIDAYLRGPAEGTDGTGGPRAHAIEAVYRVVGRTGETKNAFWARWAWRPGADWHRMSGHAIADWMEACVDEDARQPFSRVGSGRRLPEPQWENAGSTPGGVDRVAGEWAAEWERWEPTFRDMEACARDVENLGRGAAAAARVRLVVSGAFKIRREIEQELETAHQAATKMREAAEDAAYQLYAPDRAPTPSQLNALGTGTWIKARCGDARGWTNGIIIDLGGKLTRIAERNTDPASGERDLNAFIPDVTRCERADPVGMYTGTELTMKAVLLHGESGRREALDARYVAHFASAYPGGTWMQQRSEIGAPMAVAYVSNDRLVGVAMPLSVTRAFWDRWDTRYRALLAEQAGAMSGAEPGEASSDAIARPAAQAELSEAAPAAPDDVDGGVEESEDAAGADGVDADADAGPTQADRDRIEDFGQKIGGAKKDLAAIGGRGLTVTDVEQWTATEKAKLVTKDRIWPCPNYQQEIADGCDVLVAYARKRIRDGIRGSFEVTGSPRYRHRWDDERAKAWHAAVAEAAHVFNGVRTQEEMREAVAHYVAVRVEAMSDGCDGVSRRLERWEGVDGRLERLMSTRAPRRRGAYTSLIAPLEAFGSMDPDRLARLDAARQREAWPPTAEAVASAKKARRMAAAIEVRPQLQNVTREGPAYREGPASTEAMLAVFGFRGGEWGNWQSQADRQQTLNHAYDALQDLASLIDLPPDAVSLNGTLALAFGSRGSGGRRAALAHYEPFRRVINLTKMKGAGSLAHEWAHALDNFLSEGMSDGLRYASESGPARAVIKGSSALCTALDAVVLAMTKRPADDEHYRRTLEARARYARQSADARAAEAANLGCYLGREATAWANKRQPSREAAIAHAVTTLTERLQAPIGDTAKDRAKARGEAYHAFVAILTDAGARVGPTRRKSDIGSAREWRALMQAIDDAFLTDRGAEQAAEAVGAPRTAESDLLVRTDYATDAKTLDRSEGRRKPYWSSTREMFARAFEAYVFDRLQAQGIRSDYLVHGVEGDRYAGHEFGNPYPAGVERERIGEAFDGVLRELASMTRAHHARVEAGLVVDPSTPVLCQAAPPKDDDPTPTAPGPAF